MTGHEQSYAENKRVRARLVSELNAARVGEAALRMALSNAVKWHRLTEDGTNEAIRIIYGEETMRMVIGWEELLAAPQVALVGSEVAAIGE